MATRLQAAKRDGDLLAAEVGNLLLSKSLSNKFVEFNLAGGLRKISMMGSHLG